MPIIDEPGILHYPESQRYENEFAALRERLAKAEARVTELERPQPNARDVKAAEFFTAAKHYAHLQDTWPRDGWDGAADARAAHHRLVRIAADKMMAAYRAMTLAGGD